MGYNIEDISVALGVMANAGIKGSTAGTTLKNVIANMAKPTDAQAAVMQKLGISLTDSSGNMKSFAEVMNNLRTSFIIRDYFSGKRKYVGLANHCKRKRSRF